MPLKKPTVPRPEPVSGLIYSQMIEGLIKKHRHLEEAYGGSLELKRRCVQHIDDYVEKRWDAIERWDQAYGEG